MVGAAGYLHGVATGKRQGLEMAPEYVAERLTIERIEAQNDAARLAAQAQPPADRYEMCDRLMEMADHVLLEEAAEAQMQEDEHAREEERDIDFR